MIGDVEPGEPFDLPEGFDIAGIAHQDIYEPADDEAKAAVAALLAQIEADEATDETADVVVPPKDEAVPVAVAPVAPPVVADPTNPELENN